MNNNFKKRLVSLLLALATLISMIGCFGIIADAAATATVNAFDVPTKSKYAMVYTIQKTGKTTPYTTTNMDVRGSITYGKSSTAYIDNSSDLLYLIDVGKNKSGKAWARVSYPISSSKRAEAYIPLSAISAAAYEKKHLYYASSFGKFYCSLRKGGATSSSYYVAKGDKVYVFSIASTTGTNVQIMYPNSSGIWRIAYCKYDDARKYLDNIIPTVNPTSVSLSKSSVTLTGKGSTYTLSATVSPSNATNKTVTWSTSNSAVATVSNSGKVTAVSEGSTTITAKTGNGKTANCTVKVIIPTTTPTNPTVKPTTPTVKPTSPTIKPTNPTVEPTSPTAQPTNPKVEPTNPTVIPTNPKVEPTESTTEPTKPTVQPTTPIVYPTKITLSKTAVTLNAKGSTHTLTATVTPSNATNKTVAWATSNSSVATVNSAGKVTAVGNGVATITAKTANGKTATCKVTVDITVNPTKVTLSKTAVTLTTKGSTHTLTATVTPANATNKTISWTTSKSSVATVNSSGKVTAVGNGVATVTAKTANGIIATCKVTVNIIVNPTKVTLSKSAVTLTGKGSTCTLSATVSPSNATNKKVTWTTSKSSVAKVNSSGKVTAVGHGVATITAKTANGKKASCKVNVVIQYSVDNKVLTVLGVKMSEYKIGNKFQNDGYANVNGKQVYIGAGQCYGYACYIEHKLYGHCWHTAKKRFPNLSGSVNVKPTSTSKLKNLITSAGVGAHIRVTANSNGYEHSMVIIGITSNGFTVADANAHGDNKVDVRTYTWSGYLSSSYGKRAFRFIEIHK